jgi:hypothetical protein
MPPNRVHPGDERHLGGAFQDNRIIPPEGIRVAGMPAAARKHALAIAEAFVQLLPAAPRAARMREIEAHLDETWSAGSAAAVQATSSTTGCSRRCSSQSSTITAASSSTTTRRSRSTSTRCCGPRTVMTTAVPGCASGSGTTGYRQRRRPRRESDHRHGRPITTRRLKSCAIVTDTSDSNCGDRHEQDRPGCPRYACAAPGRSGKRRTTAVRVSRCVTAFRGPAVTGLDQSDRMPGRQHPTDERARPENQDKPGAASPHA